MAYAFSGYLNTSNQYIKYWIDIDLVRQDINANTSTINVIVKCKRTNTGYQTWGNGTVYARVDGQVVSEGIGTSTVFTENETLILAKQLTIGHNNDGTKTFSASAWINHSVFNSGEQGFNVTLPTIPRRSTYDITNTSPEAGSQVGVKIHRASSSFRHTFNLCVGASVYTLADKADGDWLTLTIPSIIISDYCSNSTSCQGTLWCDTYNGDNKLGYHGIGITITVPDSYQPSYTELKVTRVDNGVPSDWNCYVKGISKAKIDIVGASGSEGSTIKNYWINANNETFTTSSATTKPLVNAGSMTIKGTIKDSRGRSLRKTKYITVVDYYPPNLRDVVVNRAKTGGQIDEVDGTYLYVKASFDYAKVNDKNKADMYIKWKKTSDSTWSTPISLQPDSFHILGNGAIDVDYSWDVMVYVTDQFNTVYKTFVLPTAKTTIDLRAGGNGIAFGKVAEEDIFECEMEAQFNNGVAIRNESDINIKANLGCDAYGFLINKDLEDMYGDEDQTVFKFGNGMMVIIQKYSTTADIESAWNGICTQGSNQTDLPDFSEPFTVPPIVQMSACSTSGHALWLMRNTPPSLTNAGSYELVSGTATTNVQAQIQVLAIGRWK